MIMIIRSLSASNGVKVLDRRTMKAVTGGAGRGAICEIACNAGFNLCQSLGRRNCEANLRICLQNCDSGNDNR